MHSLQGAAFAMADVVNLRVHSFGNIEFLTRTPMAIKSRPRYGPYKLYLGISTLCCSYVLHC